MFIKSAGIACVLRISIRDLTSADQISNNPMCCDTSYQWSCASSQTMKCRLHKGFAAKPDELLFTRATPHTRLGTRQSAALKPAAAVAMRHLRPRVGIAVSSRSEG